MEFRHHSWEQAFRQPFGAVPIGSIVTLRVYATEIEKLKMRTYFDDHGSHSINDQIQRI